MIQSLAQNLLLCVKVHATNCQQGFEKWISVGAPKLSLKQTNKIEHNFQNISRLHILPSFEFIEGLIALQVCYTSGDQFIDTANIGKGEDQMGTLVWINV